MSRIVLVTLLLPLLTVTTARAATPRPDSVPPRVVVSAPSAPPTLSFGVSVEALDAGGLAGVSLALDGRVVVERIAPPWTFTVDAEAFPVEVCARATDRAGNSARDCVMVGGPFACWTEADCGLPRQYCRRGTLSCDGPGACLVMPDACPDYISPVCGCDGKTYSNECYVAAAGSNVAAEGPCPGQACGSGSDCRRGEYCARREGACGSPGACTPRPASCDCPLAGPRPTDVCGCDGHTYACAAAAACEGRSIAHEGVCE